MYIDKLQFIPKCYKYFDEIFITKNLKLNASIRGKIFIMIFFVLLL